MKNTITKEKAEKILDNLINKTDYQRIVWTRDFELFEDYECYYIRSHKGLTGFDFTCVNQHGQLNCQLEYIDLRSNTSVRFQLEQDKLQKLYDKIKD